MTPGLEQKVGRDSDLWAPGLAKLTELVNIQVVGGPRSQSGGT